MMNIWKLFPIALLPYLTFQAIHSESTLQFGGDLYVTQELTLNQEILAFSKSKKGLKVGRGECWDLAEQALTYAGAKNSANYRSKTRNGNHIWGKQVSLNQVKPGDVIQYRNFRGTRRKTQASGSWSELRFEAPHHTAILAKPLAHGAWEVFHQNNQGQQFVTRDTIFLQDSEYSEGDETVRISVEGKYWIYRPQKR